MNLADQRLTQFLARYPFYPLHLDELRQTDFAVLDERQAIYLDATGTFQPGPRSVLRKHFKMLMNNVWGNPHSELSPASLYTTQMIEQTREAVLQFFNAPPDKYVCIFALNASHALHLLGEAYQFSPTQSCLLAVDQHNSVNGIREFARMKGAQIGYVGLTAPQLRLDQDELMTRLQTMPPGLFLYPAQSNFSGVKHPLEFVELAQSLGWRVVLDAAAFAPSNPLDLSLIQPDFIDLSIYKMIGYPTGVGCLLAKRDALQELEKPWFAGGTVFVVSALGDWYILLDGYEGYEEGTPNFQAIPAVKLGLDYLSNIGMSVINERVMGLTGWLLDGLRELRHSNGQPIVRIYGPSDCTDRGATVAMNFLTPDGTIIDERVVGLRAFELNISLRPGCFCNPGVGEVGLRASIIALRGRVRDRSATFDQWLERFKLPSAGAIRMSICFPNTFADIEKALQFVASFKDFTPDGRDLPTRMHC